MNFKIFEFINKIKPIFVWFIVCWLLLYLLFFSPYMPRFESAALNDLFFIIIGVVFPLSLALTADKYASGLWRWLLIAFAAVACLPIGIAVLYTLFDLATLQDGKDISFKKINEVKINRFYYRVYQTNGGATTGFGLVVRRELPVVTGIKLVKRIKGLDGSEGKLEQLYSTRVRLSYVRYTGGKRLAYDFDI